MSDSCYENKLTETDSARLLLIRAITCVALPWVMYCEQCNASCYTGMADGELELLKLQKDFAILCFNGENQELHRLLHL